MYNNLDHPNVGRHNGIFNMHKVYSIAMVIHSRNQAIKMNGWMNGVERPVDTLDHRTRRDEMGND
jgi:hypothetical protein